jgi:hypothetical protein
VCHLCRTASAALMKPTTDGRWVHVVCVQYVHEASWFIDDGTLSMMFPRLVVRILISIYCGYFSLDGRTDR